MVIEVVSQVTRENVRACPRCGRSVKRGPRAKWCSETCRVLDAQRRRWTAGGSAMPSRPATSSRVPGLRVEIESWQEVLGRAVVRGAACELAVRQAQEALRELGRTLEQYGEDPVVVAVAGGISVSRQYWNVSTRACVERGGSGGERNGAYAVVALAFTLAQPEETEAWERRV